MKSEHRSAIVIALIVLSLGCFEQPRGVTVAVTAIAEHPALDAVRDGVRDELKEAGYDTGKNLKFVYQSAQGSPATAAQIARQFVGMPADVIVPISTPSAQAVVAVTKDIPIVFSAVTDPVRAEIVSDVNKPGGNVTGLSDFPPVEEHLKLIREIVPAAKRIGVPYNPGDSNSVSLIEHLKEIASQHGFSIVEATLTKTSDVQGAARSLVGRADVIYTMLDNTVVSALESVVAVGEQNDVPVFSGDTDSVARGAVASLGFNYYDVGRQTGQIVIRVLRGEKPASIPIKLAQAIDLVINPKAAEAMGIRIPQAVMARKPTIIGR
jgi:putative ABC transport system substrate-binding protein